MNHDELSLKLRYSSLAQHYRAVESVIELTHHYKNDAYINEEFNQGLQTAFQLVIQAIEKELK